MYIVPIAWLYVALMMALAEATSATGTILGACITFLLYGVLPITLVVYVMGAPARKRAIKAREQAELVAQPPGPTEAIVGAQPAGRKMLDAGQIRPEGWAPTGSGLAPDAGSEAGSGLTPDADSKAPTDPVAAVRKKA